jgi:hypothetical protein
VIIVEWLKRIPEFELAPDFTPNIDTTHTEILSSLPLTWSTQ